MISKKIFIISASAVVVILLIAGVFLFISIKNTQNSISDNTASGDNTFKPVKTQVKPSFIQNISNASDVTVGFHYDGDYLPGMDFGWENSEYYTPPGSTEKLLSVSKAKDRQTFAYGSDSYLSIFKSEGSHSYQGTPIYITNPNGKYFLSYLGFKINDASLLSALKVELGIDYNADVTDKQDQAPGALKTDVNSLLASLFNIPTVEACGPGLYLRKAGDSNLNLIQGENGIYWYKLEKPIDLSNLDLNYCDNPPGVMPSYCHPTWADNPPECNGWCDYNASITDLSKGNLRMHVYYKANDKEGILRMQMVNAILSDSTGSFYQTTMGQDFDHYYKAYLH